VPVHETEGKAPDPSRVVAAHVVPLNRKAAPDSTATAMQNVVDVHDSEENPNSGGDGIATGADHVLPFHVDVAVSDPATQNDVDAHDTICASNPATGWAGALQAVPFHRNTSPPSAAKQNVPDTHDIDWMLFPSTFSVRVHDAPLNRTTSPSASPAIQNDDDVHDREKRNALGVVSTRCGADQVKLEINE
jgi:hypothetical protein